MEAQSKGYATPEISAAHQQACIYPSLQTSYVLQVCLRKSIQETQQNLLEAAQTFDAAKLSVNIASAHNYQMTGLEYYESMFQDRIQMLSMTDLLIQIHNIQAALGAGITSKDLNALDHALGLAAQIGIY